MAGKKRSRKSISKVGGGEPSRQQQSSQVDKSKSSSSGSGEYVVADANNGTTTPKPKRRRKLSSKATSKADAAAETKKQGNNGLVVPTTHHHHDNTIIKHISISLAGKKKPSSSSSTTTILDASISYLIHFLETNDGDMASVGATAATTTTKDEDEDGEDASITITKQDVATLLLPWSIARLHNLMKQRATSNSNNEHEPDEVVWGWRALSSCLDILSPSSSSNKNVSNDAPISIGEAIGQKEGEEEAPSQEHEALLSSSLSQGALRSLLSFCLSTSFTCVCRTPPPPPPTTTSDDSGSDGGGSQHTVGVQLQQYASNCFIHLSKRYQPSLDALCSTLLLPLDDYLLLLLGVDESGNSNKNNNPSVVGGVDDVDIDSSIGSSIDLPYHQFNIVVALLQIITRLVMSKNTTTTINPKKLFGIVSSVGVLPCLGRLSMVRCCAGTAAGSDDGGADGGDGEAAERGEPLQKREKLAITASGTTARGGDEGGNRAKELVQTILWEGLFHPVHHMDGFRTMSELHSVPPTLPDLNLVGENEEEDAAQTLASTGEEKKFSHKQVVLAANKGKSVAATAAGGGKKKKKCFQSSLFSSLSSLFTLPPGNDEMHEHTNTTEAIIKKARQNATSTAIILPMIVHGFFERIIRSSASAQKQQGQTYTVEANAKLQFRFWCRVMVPALELLFRHPPSSNDDDGGDDGGESEELLPLALLTTTSKTLQLVLEYDAYLPSYTDPEEKHVLFLECVTRGLLEYIRRDDNEDGSFVPIVAGMQQRRQQSSLLVISSLHHLLLLNHRLLHDQLSHVIYYACRILGSLSVASPKDEARDLLCSIVKTYRELRQIGYFVTCTRGAFSAAAAAGRSLPSQELVGGGDLAFMNQLLLQGHIIESLSMAYQSCPSGQVDEIWHFFDEWIVGIASSFAVDEDGGGGDINNNGTSAKELSFAVQMFIIFIKNIRANKTNSPELRRLCEQSVSTCISKLLGKTRDSSAPDIASDSRGVHGILMRQGFDLCGWLVDLHTRSCFWIDNIDVDGKGSSFLLTRENSVGGNVDDGLNILAYLRNVAKATISSKPFKKWKTSWLGSYWQSNPAVVNTDIVGNGLPLALRGSLQRLALHRIHQLHSMIYYCNLQENERHASDLENDYSSSKALTDEARMLVDFSLYIASSQLTAQPESLVMLEESPKSLWSHVAQSLGIWVNYSDPFHVELFLIWFFSTLCQNQLKTTNLLPARRKVFQLEKNIALTLARDASFYDVSKVMAHFMKIGVQFAFRVFLGCSDIDIYAVKKLITSPRGVTLICMEFLAAEGNVNLSVGADFNAVSTALTFLASAPLELKLCNENLDLLDRLIGLDILSNILVKQMLNTPDCGDDAQHLLKIARSTKSIMANVMSKTLVLSDSDSLWFMTLSKHLSTSCSEFELDDGVLLASVNTMSECFCMCLDHHEKNSSMLKDFFLVQMELLVHGAENHDFISNASLLRSVIRTMNILNHQHALMKKSSQSKADSPYELCVRFILDAHGRLESTIFQELMAVESDQNNDRNISIALLLESDILAFLGGHMESMSRPGTIQNTKDEASLCVQKIFKLITTFQSSSSSKIVQASNYFLSVMAASPSYLFQCIEPVLALEKILESLALSHEHRTASPLLDAALCSLIRSVDLEQTKFITTCVLSKRDGGGRFDSVFVIKIFQLLMTCSNTPEQHKHISDGCNAFLLISVGLLRDRSCGRSQFISNVDLFSKTMTTLVSKKELLHLSGRHIAMIFAEINPLLRDTEETDVKGDVVIFKSCCSVVASLIAHYPKHLYGCPSPLFSLLLALMSHILHMSIKRGLSQKASEFAKICELLIPHKDIFKKHVIGLVLCYIQALNNGMNPTTKTKLMPSIYALLDMCSDFETRQINAMIEPSSKALFAPVFQSYRKVYQYHGNA